MSESQRPVPDRGAAEPVKRQKPAGGSSESTAIEGRPAPGLPHDRDESPHSTGGDQHRPVIEQARKDVENGLKDSDRGPVTDATYQKQKR